MPPPRQTRGRSGGGGRRGLSRFVLGEKRLPEARGRSSKAPSLLPLLREGTRRFPRLQPQQDTRTVALNPMFLLSDVQSTHRPADSHGELPAPLPGLPVLPAASPPCPLRGLAKTPKTR